MLVLAAVFAGLTLLAFACATGLFWAFSIAGMPAFDTLKPGEAIRAMQQIIEKIHNPFAYVTFLGAPVFSAVTGALLLIDGKTSASVLFLTAAVTYFVGVMMLTGAVLLPLNNTLAAAEVPEDQQEAAKIWAAYSPRWTRWNHVRGLFCAVSLLLAALGVHLWGVTCIVECR